MDTRHHDKREEKCELCAFNNPKGSATAVIVHDGKLLLLRRGEEPFKGQWDLPGGYMSYRETPEQALARELGEELGVEAKLTFIAALPGTGHWKGKSFAIITFAYLADIGRQEVKLNGENSGAVWLPIRELDPAMFAFDSNQALGRLVKKKFDFDLDRVRELANQLDSSATVGEQALYRAVLNGHVERVYDGDKLIGMGWIFPRQTILRHQAVVEDMIIDSNYRGRGLGQKILEKLIVWAKERGVEVVELTTNPTRIAANALYRKFGFELHPTNHYLYRIERQGPESV